MSNTETETSLKKKSKFKKLLLCATTTLIALFFLSITLLCFPNFPRNLFFAVFETYYFIPDQGSIFTFQPTTFNAGSEVFWLYGEDKSYYYYNDFDYIDGNENTITFPKNEAASCPGFDPKNISTWCQ